MKRTIFLCISLRLVITLLAQTNKQDQVKVEALLKQITLEEMVGQMTQVTSTVVASGQYGLLDTAI